MLGNINKTGFETEQREKLEKRLRKLEARVAILESKGIAESVGDLPVAPEQPVTEQVAETAVEPTVGIENSDVPPQEPPVQRSPRGRKPGGVRKPRTPK